LYFDENDEMKGGKLAISDAEKKEIWFNLKLIQK
jgi:hypothetical protein